MKVIPNLTYDVNGSYLYGKILERTTYNGEPVIFKMNVSTVSARFGDGVFETRHIDTLIKELEKVKEYMNSLEVAKKLIEGNE